MMKCRCLYLWFSSRLQNQIPTQSVKYRRNCGVWQCSHCPAQCEASEVHIWGSRHLHDRNSALMVLLSAAHFGHPGPWWRTPAVTGSGCTVLGIALAKCLWACAAALLDMARVATRAHATTCTRRMQETVLGFVSPPSPASSKYCCYIRPSAA